MPWPGLEFHHKPTGSKSCYLEILRRKKMGRETALAGGKKVPDKNRDLPFVSSQLLKSYLST